MSVHDPELRHGRKSSRHRFDGHKAAVVGDTDTQLITAADVLPGKAPDNLGGIGTGGGQRGEYRLGGGGSHGDAAMGTAGPAGFCRGGTLVGGQSAGLAQPETLSQELQMVLPGHV